MTGCTQVSPETGSGLQLHTCFKAGCVVVAVGLQLCKLGCMSAVGGRNPALSAPLLGLGSRGLRGGARPIAAAGGCGRLLMHWMWQGS